jgi:hypothetical protein
VTEKQGWKDVDVKTIQRFKVESKHQHEEQTIFIIGHKFKILCQ